MNGNPYSKIIDEVGGNGSSISMESSSSSPDPMPETPKPTSNPTPNPLKNSDSNTQCSSEQEDDDDDDRAESNNNNNNNNNKVGEKMFAVDPTLRRNSSVPSAYALQLQAAVKRAFSMRRSCSVNESYCRIHDQHVTLAPPLDEDEVSDITGTKRSVKMKMKKKKNTRDKILKAWKKIFRL